MRRISIGGKALNLTNYEVIGEFSRTRTNQTTKSYMVYNLNWVSG